MEKIQRKFKFLLSEMQDDFVQQAQFPRMILTSKHLEFKLNFQKDLSWATQEEITKI